MANENRFKLKLSRIFRTSLASCRSKHLSDTIQSAVLSPQTLHSFRTVNDDEAEPLKSRSFSSAMICRPKPSFVAKEQIDIHDCIKSTMNVMLPTPRPRLARYRFSSFSESRPRPKTRHHHHHNRRPQSSSVFPMNPFYEQSKTKKKKKIKTINGNKCGLYKKSQKKTTLSKARELFPFSSSSLDSNLGGWWFSSSDDDDDDDDGDEDYEKRQRNEETDTRFSHKTPTSDSSEVRRRQRRRRAEKENVNAGLVGGVKDSFAVVKKSSDPHNDFRTSMVEMIVEKQIFSAKDLESLLQCFLSLNSETHHCVIVEVFTEILEALFSNCGS